MSAVSELWEKDKSMFSGFNNDKWIRYYDALNDETPVDDVKDEPYYLDLSDNEKKCYEEALRDLVEERKTFPQAGYEVQLRYLDD